MNEKVLNEARNIIASFLKNRRLELNITQEQLALLTGLGRQTIIRAENASFWLGMKQYLIICEALSLFPLLATIEEDSDIAESLRSNWIAGPSISIKKAEKLLAILKAKENKN